MLNIVENMNAHGAIGSNCVIILRNGKSGEFAPVHYVVEDDLSFHQKMSIIEGEMNGIGISLTTHQTQIAWLRWLESGKFGDLSSHFSSIERERYIRVFGRDVFPALSAILWNVERNAKK